MVEMTDPYCRAPWPLFITIVCMALLGACISDPHVPDATSKPLFRHNDLSAPLGARNQGADLEFISFDARSLPVSVWQPAPSLLDGEKNKQVKAVLIALHGMNDYAFAFDQAAQYWAAHNIAVYAYDQRTFGRGRLAGDKWPGTHTLVADLVAVQAAIRARHSDVPLFVLGHSMGGAVVMVANGQGLIDADGVILAAPAIWGGARMPLFYRASLSIAASLAPGKTLTGARAKRQATDNIPVLRVMQKDPNIIRETNLRAVAGLVRLMGAANASVDQQHGDVLFLVGCRDQMVPVADLLDVAGTMSARAPGADTSLRADLQTYPEGWHLLFRDLQAQKVWHDVASWIDRRINAITHTDRLAENDHQKNSAAQPNTRFNQAAPYCPDK